MIGLMSALLGAAAPPSVTPATPSAPPPDADYWYDNAGAGRPSVSGRFITSEIAMQISTVYACINLLAKSVATMPLGMYRTDKSNSKFYAPEHPLNDVLTLRPNSWQTPFDFKACMMMHLALRGNAYAEIIPGRRGAVDSLEPLHPDYVTVERLVDRSLRYTISDDKGRTRKLVQDEVFHIRSPVCPTGIIGTSPIAYAKEGLGLTLSVEEHGNRMFSNGARPSGAIEMPGRMREDDFKRYKAEINANYGSNANSHKTMVLQDGAKFHAISLRADELQMLQTRLFQIEEIARWFDIPLVMLHSNDKTTSWGTGVEAIMIAFVRNTLMPWIEAWEQAISRDLIIAPHIYTAEFDDTALQRGDSKALAEFFQKLVLAGIITRNEARVALRYNTMEGLDEPLVPANSLPASAVPEQPEAANQNAPSQDDE